tara:strand:- start:90 stop:635 length:546 start_codon:yes stop_codon:yes gene_type:complete
MIIVMKKIILIPILLSTILLVGCGETPEDKKKLSNDFNKSDWEQCPKPKDIFSLSPNNINNTDEFKTLVSSMVAVGIPPQTETDDSEEWLIPISIEPNQNCDGLIVETVMTGTFDSAKLWATRELLGGIGASAGDICTEPRMSWMRDFGYTTREIVKTEKNQIIYDITYDFDSCTEYQKYK